jgi:hypothetical protein
MVLKDYSRRRWMVVERAALFVQFVQLVQPRFRPESTLQRHPERQTDISAQKHLGNFFWCSDQKPSYPHLKEAYGSSQIPARYLLLYNPGAKLKNLTKLY